MFDTNQPAYLAFRHIAKERTDDIFVWVGAGLSVPADMPSWTGLMKHLAGVLQAKATTLETTECQKLKARAESAKNCGNLWIAFQILKEALGETTYTDEIRKKFLLAAKCEIPPMYERLWRIGIDGMLNLNIDRLATRAYNNVFGGKTVPEFVGKSAGRMMHSLRSPEPFLANLHGEREDPASWIFTQAELSNLLQDAGYIEFIRQCCSSATILFIGITADDVAVGGHIAKLKEMGIKLNSHYWVSDRCDANTDSWVSPGTSKPATYGQIKTSQ